VSDNLMDSIAPQLAPPVSREPIRSAAESEEGAETMIVPIAIPFFADDDAE
jgi:small neutral amino acid transporter SnatA (MarC family)